jgi:hypothetical protein
MVGSSVITLGLALTPPGRINSKETRFSLRQMTLVFVDDLDARMERVDRCGGSVLEPPTDQPWGLRQAVIRDPEGYIWELSKHTRDVGPRTGALSSRGQCRADLKTSGDSEHGLTWFGCRVNYERLVGDLRRLHQGERWLTAGYRSFWTIPAVHS